MPELHLLTGAYALDALDDVERAGFERHLRECPACSTEVSEFHEAVVSLAGRVAEPAPPQLRDRVLSEVSRTRQLPPVAHRSLPRLSFRRSIAGAAAAVLVAGSAALGGIAWQGHRAEQTAQAEAAQIAQVMTNPGKTEVTGSPAGGGFATVVAAGGSAVFAADQLPPLPDGKDYQLWLIDSTGIRSEGVLDLRSGGGQELVAGVRPGSSIAVSVEPEGGSQQPTTTPVLNLKVV
jgi:anti-sigma factor RsiW